MRLKGTLPFLGALVCFIASVNGDEAAPTEDPMTVDYTPKETLDLVELYQESLNTIQPLGPDVTCTSNSDCSAYKGTECYGVEGALKCICNPYDYYLDRDKLGDYILSAASAGNSNWEHRPYYKADADGNGGKCLSAKKLGESCEDQYQCTYDDGVDEDEHTCSSGKCACRTYWEISEDKESCELPGYRESCDSTLGCINTGFVCTAGTCQCDTSNQLRDKSPRAAEGTRLATGDEGACQLSMWGETCVDSDAHCDGSLDGTYGHRYLTCNDDDNECECNPTYFVTKTGDAAPEAGDSGSEACQKIAIGSTTCTSRWQCLYGDGAAICDTDDSGGTCKCSESSPVVGNNGVGCSEIAYNSGPCLSTSFTGSDFDTDGNVQTFNAGFNNARCVGNTVCAPTDDTHEDKCVCDDATPQWDSGLQTCREIYVDDTGCEAMPSSIKSTDYDGNDETRNGRCFDGTDGTVSTYCDTSTDYGTCRCRTTSPLKVVIDDDDHIHNGEAISCRDPGWGQACDTGNDQCPTGLECDGGSDECRCDNDDDYYEDDGKTTAEKTGQTAAAACIRISLNAETGCENDGEITGANCEAHALRSGRAVCDGDGKCQCKTGYIQYEKNICEYEFDHGAACVDNDAAANDVMCFPANLTCDSTTNVCGCKDTFADNVYDTTKKNCRHEDASYSRTHDQTCTHDLILTEIDDLSDPDDTDHNKWRRKTSGTTIGTRGQTVGSDIGSAVLVCVKDSLVCYATDYNTDSSILKCLNYVKPTAPDSGTQLTVTIWTMLVLVIAAMALA